jgi:hypothetical protein
MSFKDAVNLSKDIKNLKGILSIIYFGSISHSDPEYRKKTNLAIIYSSKDKEVIKKIKELATANLETHHLTWEELIENPQLIGVISGEGILLHGKPIQITTENSNLKSMMIISYDTTGINQNERNKLNRALHGGISTYKKDDVRIVKEYPGLVEKVRAQKLGKGVIMVDRFNSYLLIQTLKRMGAEWKEIPIWTY